jgi:hypothetical protein
MTIGPGRIGHRPGKNVQIHGNGSLRTGAIMLCSFFVHLCTGVSPKKPQNGDSGLSVNRLFIAKPRVHVCSYCSHTVNMNTHIYS